MSDRERIKKVKFDGSLVEITTERTWGVGNEKLSTLKSYDQPTEAFEAAFRAFPPAVRRLLDLPERWAEGALKVLSVSFSWSESTSVQGATITCRADLKCATSPLIFNTPHLPYAQYSEGGEQPLMPDELIELLDDLEGQAGRYLAGERAQGDLFSGAKVTDRGASTRVREDA